MKDMRQYHNFVLNLKDTKRSIQVILYQVHLTLQHRELKWGSFRHSLSPLSSNNWSRMKTPPAATLSHATDLNWLIWNRANTIVAPIEMKTQFNNEITESWSMAVSRWRFHWNLSFLYSLLVDYQEFCDVNEISINSKPHIMTCLEQALPGL